MSNNRKRSLKTLQPQPPQDEGAPPLSKQKAIEPTTTTTTTTTTSSSPSIPKKTPGPPKGYRSIPPLEKRKPRKSTSALVCNTLTPEQADALYRSELQHKSTATGTKAGLGCTHITNRSVGPRQYPQLVVEAKYLGENAQREFPDSKSRTVCDALTRR